MKVYEIVHKQRALCQVLTVPDAELLQHMLKRLGIQTTIKTRGVAYRHWPDTASPPLILLVLDQATGNLECRTVVGQVLFNKRDAVIYFLKRICQLYQRLVQLK